MRRPNGKGAPANSKPHLWLRRGCNCYKQGRGRRRVRASRRPLRLASHPPAPIRIHFPLLYLALTLLRGNLLINSQLVSAARRLINRRRVARWRHAQNPPSAPRRRDLRAFILKCSPPGRHYRARLPNLTARRAFVQLHPNPRSG